VRRIESFLDICYEKARQYKKVIWLILAVLAVAFIILTVVWCYNLIFTYPVNQVSQINNVTEADLVNKYRSTSVQIVAIIAQIFGGIAIFAGLIFAWGNLTTAREGQITERFTRAVDQLGNEKLEIRLGGIYALERIANESDKDYWQIMEILTAYVRNNSSFEVARKKNVAALAMDIQVEESTKSKAPKSRKMPIDIQAILNVIKRRKYSYLIGRPTLLNLNNTDLQMADLGKANLEMFFIQNANLKLAFLVGANLKRAILGGTNLQLALLLRADFQGAKLDGADLTGANLEGAKNLTIDQLSKVKTLYNAKLDEELLIPLKEKYPTLFEKPKE
jgi:Uncharacterized low-complexity proteins